MEVPSTAAGTVRDVKVKVGDKVAEGTPLISVEIAEAAAGDSAAGPRTECTGSNRRSRGG